ncbi:MAG: hypothetical protein K0S32_477 [Bacteroidetes bacterium]|jgi:hypothetical protein|nr:hypothetical protein [Bacteroidota bacterium]
MKKTVLILMILGAGLMGFSQTPAKKENVKNLLEITMAGELGANMGQRMIASFKTSYKSVPGEFWDEFAKEIKAEDLVALIIPIYQKYYSDEEITELIKFYKTPLGKKVTTNNQLIAQESYLAGQQWGKEIGMRALEKMKEKGYDK